MNRRRAVHLFWRSRPWRFSSCQRTDARTRKLMTARSSPYIPPPRMSTELTSVHKWGPGSVREKDNVTLLRTNTQHSKGVQVSHFLSVRARPIKRNKYISSRRIPSAGHCPLKNGQVHSSREYVKVLRHSQLCTCISIY